ncbi:MAG: hypothetical protein RL291_851 [Pseudomonadota bacterium]
MAAGSFWLDFALRMLILVLVLRSRAYGARTVALVWSVLFILAGLPLSDVPEGPGFVSNHLLPGWLTVFFASWLLPLVALYLAPPKLIAQRLLFLLMGLGLLLALNMLWVWGSAAWPDWFKR